LKRQHLDYVRRSILENGVTYNVYADPKGADRPWELDPLPLILSPDEWAGISVAVTQRARLLNALLGDLYGEQTLLRTARCPRRWCTATTASSGRAGASASPATPGCTCTPPTSRRSPDGRWWVIGDRTQAPSGAGYALENRLIVSRLFSEKFRDLRVQHLASFFAALQDSWPSGRRSPSAKTTPLIVLLTPGPYNETYSSTPISRAISAIRWSKART